MQKFLRLRVFLYFHFNNELFIMYYFYKQAPHKKAAQQ